MHKLNTLAVIPARSGSKGIKNKNLKRINGKSLIKIASEVASKSKIFKHIVLTSDSIKYKNEIDTNSYQFILRNKKISNDKSNSLSAWRDAFIKMEKLNKIKYDYSVLLEPTNPFRKISDLHKIYKLMISHNFDGILTLSEKPKSFTDQKTLIIKNNKLKYYLINGSKYTIRQTIPVQYYRNGIGYISTSNYLKRCKNNFLSGKIGFLIIDRININIDTINDLKLTRLILSNV